jgi:hypothetical protein
MRKEIRMIELVKAKRYHLRLLEQVAFCEEVRVRLLFDQPEGTIVSEQAVIDMLEARGAPVERIAPLEIV